MTFGHSRPPTNVPFFAVNTSKPFSCSCFQENLGSRVFHSEVNPCSPTHKLASSEIWFTSDSSIFSNKLGCFWWISHHSTAHHIWYRPCVNSGNWPLSVFKKKNLTPFSYHFLWLSNHYLSLLKECIQLEYMKRDLRLYNLLGQVKLPSPHGMIFFRVQRCIQIKWRIYTFIISV